MPENRLHVALMTHLKIGIFFINTFFHTNTRPLEHLIRGGCFAWLEHKVLCLKRRGYQRHTQTNAGKATDLKDLSYSWSCLPVTFLKYDWLESKRRWWPRDWWELRDVSPFEVLPAWRLCRPFMCCLPYPLLLFSAVLMQRTGAICLCFDCGISMSVGLTGDLAFVFSLPFHPWTLLDSLQCEDWCLS